MKRPPADAPGPGTVALRHRDFGGAGGPPLILLHGLLGSSRNWQTAGRDFAAVRRTHALDLRNHGESPHAPDMHWDHLVGDVVRWLNAHRVERAEILGHSLGGKVAMRLACRHPERVARLTVVDIAPKAYQWIGHRAEFAAMHELDFAGLDSRRTAELRLEARVPDLGLRKFLLTNLERTDGGWRWVVNLPVLTEWLPVMEGDSLEAGDAFAGPTAFILGGRSRYVAPSDHEGIRTRFPAARIETIAAAGHSPHMEQREAFVQAVLAAPPPV
jgi:esterase